MITARREAAARDDLEVVPGGLARRPRNVLVGPDEQGEPGPEPVVPVASLLAPEELHGLQGPATEPHAGTLTASLSGFGHPCGWGRDLA